MGGHDDESDVGWTLRERVKELTLLHAVARLLQGGRHPDAALLEELVALVPPAWRYSDLCEARIRWLHVEARTPGFSATRWTMSMPLGAAPDGGVLEIAYREVPPESAADPFLKEERDLAASLAELLGASFARSRAEIMLREREARLTFLYALSERTRNATDADEILAIVVGMLGRELRASRCAVVHVEDHGRRCWIPHDYTDGCESVVGPYEMTSVGADMILAAGGPIVLRDIPREQPGPIADKQATIGVQAMIIASHVQGGAIRSLLAVQQTTPRDWTEHEIMLVTETVARTWAHIEQRATQAKLREHEWLVRVAGQVARVGGWSIEAPDPAGRRHVRWSPEICEIHGMPAGTKPTYDEALAFYTPACREVMADAIDACLRDGVPFDVELEHVDGGASEMWVRAVGRAERDAGGHIVRLQGACQDVSERRRLEAHLRQAQKMEAIGQVAASVAHDFNNLLSVILSYSTFIVDGLGEGEPLRADVSEIRSAAQRGVDLTRQLLTFGRKQALKPCACHLPEIVAGIEKMLHRLVGDRVRLSLRCDPSAGQTLVDPGQIEQVLMNLVVNARDAMHGSGDITVLVENATLDASQVDGQEIASGEYVRLAVIDTGHGMDAATRARIFEPFFTTKEKGKGTGLGLATVYGVVKQSGANIQVVSKVGVGTTFSIHFPRIDHAEPKPAPLAAPVVEPPAAAEPVEPAKFTGNGEHILLVDDEDALVLLTQRVLKRLGYRVTGFTSGAEALGAFRAQPDAFQAVVTDISMPGMGGFQLVRHLWAVRPDMPIVATSGYFTDDDMRSAAAVGLRSLVVKPDTVEELGRVLHDALAHDLERRAG